LLGCISVLLFIFNMYKCITSGTLRDAPIVLRLCRDGSAYFILVLVTLIISTLVSFRPDLILLNAAKNLWISAIFSYAGSNLLLSVRSFAAQRVEFDTMSLMSFAKSRSANALTVECA